MAFTTNSLPDNGKTAHFAISYDDALSQAHGLHLALDLLKHCENDLTLICRWFTGVTFQFSFPIGVQITGDSGGASWMDPSDFQLWFGFNPTVKIKPGPNPSSALVRYLLVSEVTEMYMASQQKQWFESTNLFSGADEGSMGESLSRFLASEFLITTGISDAIFPGFQVAGFWLNDPLRPDYVNTSPDDNRPDPTVGCGTCFLFFLKNQLKKSIQDIIAAAAPTLGGVYTNLTGKADGWQSFKNLVDLHYPLDRGRKYYPPLDDVFPVAELSNFVAPPILSWVENDPNMAALILSHSIPVNVDVVLSSDDPATISMPARVPLSSSAPVMLTVPGQPATFTEKVVNLAASYAGKKITYPVKVVRPENLPIVPLLIGASHGHDRCARLYMAGSPQDFQVCNPNVIRDKTGLTYNWTVSGAIAPITNTPILHIPSLPAEGTRVTIDVELKNAYGIHSSGTLEFTTTSEQLTLSDLIRQLQCSLGQIKEINKYIPPWVPIEEGNILLQPEQLVAIEQQARSLIVAAKRVIVSSQAVRSGRIQAEKT